MILHYSVGVADEGRRFYSVLRRELGLSSSMVRTLKVTGGICVDGQSAFTDYRLMQGQTVSVDVSLAEPACELVPQRGELEVLYEDEGLLAVNKAPGLLIHPSRAKYTDTLANYVSGYLLDTCGDGSCHAVGRLDRDTSGAVLFAKNSYMMYRMSGSVEEKTYLAAVYGAPEQNHGVIDLPIRRKNETDFMRIVASDGKSAVTRYERIRTISLCGQTVSLLRLVLETGRTHQIRVHCAALGLPLLGDVLYHTPESAAFSERAGFHAQALHCEGFSLTHPLTGEALRISAPLLRRDMEALLRFS